MQRKRSKLKKCDWMVNSFLRNMPISREPLIRISRNWSFEKNWTLTKEILDNPVNLQQGIIKDRSVKLLLQ